MKSKRDLTKEELEKREKRKLAGIYRKLDKDAKKIRGVSDRRGGFHGGLTV